jgi:hypothetical protein
VHCCDNIPFLHLIIHVFFTEHLNRPWAPNVGDQLVTPPNFIMLDLRVSHEAAGFSSIKRLLLVELRENGVELPCYKRRVNVVDVIRQRIGVLLAANSDIAEKW